MLPCSHVKKQPWSSPQMLPNILELRQPRVVELREPVPQNVPATEGHLTRSRCFSVSNAMADARLQTVRSMNVRSPPSEGTAP